MPTPARPNILLAIADDASHMSAYGHKFLNTPNFDRVAEAGVLFRNAFTTNPKCAPSRACILTGRHTWQLEEACNHCSIFPSKFAVYPDILENAGYHVGYTGKGWMPGDYIKGGFKRNPAGSEYNKRKLIPPANTCISACDYTENFNDFLNERPKGSPFCFWYGGFEPHRPYKQGEGSRAGKLPEDIDYIPSYLPDNEIVRNDILDYASEIEWFDKHLGQMLDILEKIGELENTLVIVTSDNGMPFPRLKGQMYEQDFHLPMAACWTKASAGSRILYDMISFIDIAPTILTAAGTGIHPQITGRSFLDIILSNRDEQVDITRDRVYFGREKHDVGREGDLGYPVRCIRTQKYLYARNFAPERWPAGNPETGFTNCDSSPTKDLILKLNEEGNSRYYDLCFGKRAAEELYDIEKDQECINNLANDPKFSDIKGLLRSELEAELIKTGDPRLTGDEDIFDNYPTMKEYNHSWKAYIEGWWQKQRY